MTDVTVVVPTFNAAETIRLQLDALAAQETSRAWELIVADNGSTDSTAAIAGEYAHSVPHLRVVNASAKRGPAYALNEGARVARGTALVFCDADDEVAAGWLDAMAAALERHDLVACRQEIEKLNEPWVRATRGPSLMVEDVMRLPFPPYVRHAPSSGLGIRRILHERIGGFDEALPTLYDTDYCIRLHRLGIEPVLVPDALLHYRYRPELRAIFRQARSYAESGALLQKRYGAERAVPAWRWPVKHWRPVLGELARVHRKAARGRLAWLLGWQIGRYVGSARYRVLAI